MGGETQTTKVGSPSDVQNVNPMTSGFYNQLGNQNNQWAQMLQGSMAQTQGGGDPMAGYNAFMSYAPGLQNLVSGQNSEYAQSQLGLAQAQAREGVNQAMSQYAGPAANGLYSGAAAGAASQAAQMPYMQAVSNITGAQNQMFGNLANNALGTMPQAYNQQTQNQLQQQSLLGSLFGQGQQIQGQMAMPEWWQPSYITEEGGGGLGGLFSGMAAGGSAGSMFGPWGTAIGAGIGGLGGLFG